MRRITVVAFGVLACFRLLATPVTLAQTTSPRKVMTRIAPTYPQLAREMRLKGVVSIEVVVRPDGSVKSTKVLGGTPVFVEPGIYAVRQWKFEVSQNETKERVELSFVP
jgi:TonB family protein